MQGLRSEGSSGLGSGLEHFAQVGGGGEEPGKFGGWFFGFFGVGAGLFCLRCGRVGGGLTLLGGGGGGHCSWWVEGLCVAGGCVELGGSAGSWLQLLRLFVGGLKPKPAFLETPPGTCDDIDLVISKRLCIVYRLLCLVSISMQPDSQTSILVIQNIDACRCLPCSWIHSSNVRFAGFAQTREDARCQMHLQYLIHHSDKSNNQSR